MLAIPLSPAARRAETAIIIQIAAVNHLDINVDQLTRRISARPLLAENGPLVSTPQCDVRWLRPPYLGKSSDRLVFLLKRYNYQVDFYSPLTLSNLVRLKDPTPPQDRSGIYELKRGDFPAVYIGQTGRKLSTRLAEHRTALNPTSTKKPAFADHCRTRHHNFDKTSTSLIHVCNKGPIMNKLEETETIAAATSTERVLVNDLAATFVTPFIRYFFKFAPTNPNNDINNEEDDS